MKRVLCYLSGIIGILGFFGTPLIYIYNEHLTETQEKSSFIWLSIVFIILLFITILSIKFIFSLKGIYQLKLFIFTTILMCVLYGMYNLFVYIELNASDITQFLLVWIASIFIGYWFMIPFIHKLHKDKII